MCGCFMEILILAALIAFLTGFSGFVCGAVFVDMSKSLSRRFHGGLMGFTGGLLIAFVCFEMLPDAFARGSMSLGVIGLALGAGAAAWLEKRAGIAEKAMFDGKKRRAADRSGRNGGNYMRTGLLIASGIALHKLPEGMAMGALLHSDLIAGLYFCGIIALHCFPEGVSIAVPLTKSGVRLKKLIGLFALICLPMGVGSFLGAAADGASGSVTSFCLAFASGIMIYVTCGSILPESKETWRGRFSSAGAAFGFVLGIIATSWPL